MNLMKKTKLGTLTAGYRPGDTRPGFWVSLYREKQMRSLCTVEYDPDKDCIQVMIYGDADSDKPTHIIEINPENVGKEG